MFKKQKNKKKTFVYLWYGLREWRDITSQLCVYANDLTDEQSSIKLSNWTNADMPLGSVYTERWTVPMGLLFKKYNRSDRIWPVPRGVEMKENESLLSFTLPRFEIIPLGFTADGKAYCMKHYLFSDPF